MTAAARDEPFCVDDACAAYVARADLEMLRDSFWAEVHQVAAHSDLFYCMARFNGAGAALERRALSIDFTAPAAALSTRKRAVALCYDDMMRGLHAEATLDGDGELAAQAAAAERAIVQCDAATHFVVVLNYARNGSTTARGARALLAFTVARDAEQRCLLCAHCGAFRQVARGVPLGGAACETCRFDAYCGAECRAAGAAKHAMLGECSALKAARPWRPAHERAPP